MKASQGVVQELKAKSGKDSEKSQKEGEKGKEKTPKEEDKATKDDGAKAAIIEVMPSVATIPPIPSIFAHALVARLFLATGWSLFGAYSRP